MLSLLSLLLSLHLSPDLIPLSGASLNLLMRFSRQRVAGGTQDFRYPACLNGALLALNAGSPSPSVAVAACWAVCCRILPLVKPSGHSSLDSCCHFAMQQPELRGCCKPSRVAEVRGEFHSLKDHEEKKIKKKTLKMWCF